MSVVHHAYRGKVAISSSMAELETWLARMRTQAWSGPRRRIVTVRPAECDSSPWAENRGRSPGPARPGGNPDTRRLAYHPTSRVLTQPRGQKIGRD